MADLTINQPPIIDASGNIDVHGREGLSIPFKRYTDIKRTTQVDISGDVLTFEVDISPTRYVVNLAADPNDAKGRLLLVPDLKAVGIFVTPDNTPGYVVRDATGSVARVRMEGLLVVRGWEV